MKGSLQKHIDSSVLACRRCNHFRDNDPDVFYCELDQAEFPSLCKLYSFKNTQLDESKTVEQ